ncbi:S41 family peptidase [Cohnella thailandensis]|uniref:S41 family peptidase n=1 Tax=Cohnella thailandensis TaxID=557557 RepID=A0A841T3X7_9BACL|nr:S41 family peptidase [Cohnella thailandensis]MBB6638322.1 S41 family peptidase [Cohnella thailandensis]MBP1977200.1 carboxyl-terminal processing protease [Cohnella thailandensis]
MNSKKLRPALLLLTLTGMLASAAPSATAATAQQVEDVKQMLEQYHLVSPSEEALNDAAIQGMVDSLQDPYTQYFSEEEWTSFNSSLEQEYVGIGVVLQQDQNQIFIENVIDGSPAAKAGLKPGDALLSVNNVSVQGKSVGDAITSLSGLEGSTVRVVVGRNGASVTAVLTRSSFQYPLVVSQSLGQNVQYLQLTQFSTGAANKFKEELTKLENSGISSLIIDLRDNSGGYLNEAQGIAANFIKEGVLAHLVDSQGADVPLEIEGTEKSYPVYVLINGYSASASELLSGALRDYGVAKLIGSRTYGKGVVQQLLQVPSGGYLKVTNEEYYTPKGIQVDKKGLTPDIAVDGEVQQLIAAFRQAGGTKLTLTAGKGAVVVNGVRTSYSDSVVRKNGTAFLDLKLAAALSGATFGYEKSTQSIVFKRNNQTVRVKSNKAGLYIANGTTYVSPALLAQWVPGLQSSDSNGLLKLSL